MEARATVMSDDEVTRAIGKLPLAEWEEICNLPERQRDRILQAKISFEAGIEQGKVEGRREVVKCLISDDNGLTITIYGDKWGAKLKEWGG